MFIVYCILTSILFITTILPRFNDQHWFFRVWDFGKVQLTIIQVVLLLIGIYLLGFSGLYVIGLHILLIISIVLNVSVLIPFTTIFRTHSQKKTSKNSKNVKILSINVYQFNKQYQRLIDLVKDVRPDILLTMESNKDWDRALSVLDNDFKHFKKIPQENTYGMHFYTNLEVLDLNVNHFVADDIPSIECKLKIAENWEFTFYGIHPPPPSPTEEENSKERDGELLSVAKLAKDKKEPVIVAGDFNNVAWAKSSMLFKRISQLIDPRVGRGFISTFHAKYWFMRFPIDLFFHSKYVYITEFKTLKDIGSDHFPLYCEFYLGRVPNPETEHLEEPQENDEKEAEELINEGIKENGNRDKVATE